MTERITFEQLLGPGLDACRTAVEHMGGTWNLTSYAGGGRPLLSIAWAFDEPDDKGEVSRLIGRAGWALGADLIVSITDSWFYETPRGSDPTIDTEKLTTEVPFSERPGARESLDVLGVTMAGVGWWRIYPYGRDDQGAVVWDEPHDITLTTAPRGRYIEGLLAGYQHRRPSAPAPQLESVIRHLGHRIGQFNLIPLDQGVADDVATWLR